MAGVSGHRKVNSMQQPMVAFPSHLVGKEIDTRPTIVPGDGEAMPAFYSQGRPLNESSDVNLPNPPTYGNPTVGERLSAIDKTSETQNESQKKKSKSPIRRVVDKIFGRSPREEKRKVGYSA